MNRAPTDTEARVELRECGDCYATGKVGGHVEGAEPWPCPRCRGDGKRLYALGLPRSHGDQDYRGFLDREAITEEAAA